MATNPMAGAGPDQDTPVGDPVATVVDDVRRDLAARRAAGQLPPIAADEIARQFSAVVEASDSGIITAAPLDPASLAPLAGLAPPDALPAGASALARARRIVRHPLSATVGVVIRTQVGAFAQRVTELLTEVVHRQNNVVRFLMRAHLDRVRSLEHRVAELERQLDAARAGRDES